MENDVRVCVNMGKWMLSESAVSSKTDVRLYGATWYEIDEYTKGADKWLHNCNV